MSRQQLIRLVGVLVVALVVWGVLALVRGPVRDDDGGELVPSAIDTATVDSIVIARFGDTSRVGRAVGGIWRVNGHPVDTAAVAGMLRVLPEPGLRTELVATNATSHAALEVDSTQGRRVRVVAGGRTVFDLVTGKRTADRAGVYARRSGEDAVFAVHGALVEPSQRYTDDWRDKRIAAVEPDSVEAIEIRRAGHGYSLRRREGKWVFPSGAVADSGAVASLLAEYRRVTAAGFATPSQADSANFARPGAIRARLAGRSGAMVNLIIDSTASHVWTRTDSGGMVFRLDPWVVARLAPAESALRVRR